MPTPATTSVAVTPTLLTIGGTVFIDRDIVTPSDPSELVSITDAGTGNRTMFDRRLNAFATFKAFLFNASYANGRSVEIQVNPEFQNREKARAEAEKYARLVGQLPRTLRRDLETVWIHQGVELFGGGNNNVLIHTGQASLYEQDGVIEEVLIHEAAHTSLDADHAASSGWLQAQADDRGFISDYAEEFPSREDIAESFLPWMALRYGEDRISADLAFTIRTRMPNRLVYFDAQSFPMAPVR